MKINAFHTIINHSSYAVYVDLTVFLFSLSRMDTFRLEGIDLGELIKLRIGHDNRGVGPGWFLDKVSIGAWWSQGFSVSLKFGRPNIKFRLYLDTRAGKTLA